MHIGFFMIGNVYVNNKLFFDFRCYKVRVGCMEAPLIRSNIYAYCNVKMKISMIILWMLSLVIFVFNQSYLVEL
jgi:hypothetical protein